ncbi:MULTISPECIES: dTDP-4-dehydrorhamnose reductase [unclassified Clostridioides]|uniref:dTDP-4-dehydrorhamnose reductase n=1 Tax=unclassified Clostridioides TaxID=2635829 RepID=UPI001D121F66|nr:dTDP-4-dehydrorhamnose reductase [Clostridioides sp. ZZV15-6388]MCC0644173.1 dTDP-4-dehydrorhamnose reductase [Clostridioides sp. ZZV14-6150]MCC0661060.1 dTDP-4-dehydrorhamnose reductase [Clostridioides sp. ZZV14-6154]MCC0722519.1 dTDP-4-dehydrorhamnose reductase [Clostridioides sp. ZZV14-6104]MCC0729908.1 dTDP-4-dehydrorhamnose reductase [Clostridioides sp. ZZV14-6048]MCC0734790.1 dTDP-4-dehydrorhamnose reductase [Clostridioides sp. ZZV14-6009]MCC0743344.1 dTDP-4-dehydrorhamnose reductase
MKILITGSNGQLGKELVNQLKSINQSMNQPKYTILATTRDDLDISNQINVDDFILYNKPDVVINCAAYTKVDVCEDNIEIAYKINALGARSLAIASERVNAKLVHISTDYVFNGFSKYPYREDNKTEPNSVYGKSKLMGEKFVEQFSHKYFILRTAWLYGDGNNFVKTMIKLSLENKEVNVVNDQFGSPTSTVDLAKVIIRIMETENYGVYHATCEGQCSWYDFAKKIFELKNIDIKVNPIKSSDFKSKVQRPQYSVLDNFMLKLIGLNSFRVWEESIEEYLKVYDIDRK